MCDSSTLHRGKAEDDIFPFLARLTPQHPGRRALAALSFLCHKPPQRPRLPRYTPAHRLSYSAHRPPRLRQPICRPRAPIILPWRETTR